MARCRVCNEREARPGAIAPTGCLTLMLGLGIASSDAYCEDCGAGLGFVWLLATVAVLVLTFVLIVALG